MRLPLLDEGVNAIVLPTYVAAVFREVPDNVIVSIVSPAKLDVKTQDSILSDLVTR